MASSDGGDWRDRDAIPFEELAPALHAQVEKLRASLDRIAAAFEPVRAAMGPMIVLAQTLHDTMQPGTPHGDRNHFIAVMARQPRSPDECMAAARRLAAYGRLTTFRMPDVRQYLRTWIAVQGKARVRAELAERYAAECIAGWTYLRRHHGQLLLDDVDDWLRRWARQGIAASLPLPPPRGHHFELVDPHVLEEPGLRQLDPTQPPDGIDVAIAHAAERRALLVADGPEEALPRPSVHLPPQERALARLLMRRVRGLTPVEREAVLVDPAVRIQLATALGCTRRAVTVYLVRLRAAAAAL